MCPLTQTTDRTQHVETLIRVQQGSQRTLENEIVGVRKEIKGFRDRIEDLLEERDRVEGDIASATQKYFTVLEQVSLGAALIWVLVRGKRGGHARGCVHALRGVVSCTVFASASCFPPWCQPCCVWCLRAPMCDVWVG
jgi:hypothetical protein